MAFLQNQFRWLGVLGLAPYPLLAVLSAKFGDQIYSWGDLSTAQGLTKHGLTKHVLRAEYGTFDLIGGFDRSRSGFWRGMKLYFDTVQDGYLHLAAPSTTLLTKGFIAF
ncbi:hypothetical protein T484DRAFT_1821533 [Baffinella frigidus]|nr:hypothetical protein T484DRAFT_1821533 [Cryptophyta sp. CCMP2293]